MAAPDAEEPRAAGGPLAQPGVGARVVRGGALRGAGFVVANLLNAAGAVILLRHLGVRDVGRYGTVIALLAIVQGISDAGLSMTGARELSLAEDPERRRALLGHVLGLRIALTGAGVLAAVAFALLAGYDRDLVLGTLIAGAGVFLVSVQGAMLLPLAVELRNGTIALNEVLRQAVLVASFAALALAGAGLLPFFAAPVAAGLALLLATPLLLHREHLVAPSFRGGELRALAEVGLPVAVANVLGVLYFRMLVVLMSLVSGDELQVGYYVTSTRVVELVVGLPLLLVSVVVPVLTVAARSDRARLERGTARLTEVLLLAGVLAALVTGLAAEPLLVLLGGEAFRPAADVLRIESIVLVTVFVTAAWSPVLLAMGRVRALAGVTALGLLAVIAAGAALIPAHEARGAALAAVLADLVVCAATYAAVRAAGPGRALAAGRLARIALAGGAALGVALLSGLAPIAQAALAAALLAVLALALGAVPRELRAVLGRGDGGYAARG